MYGFNNQAWPIVLFEFKGIQTLEEHEQSLQDWNQEFARNEAFVAVRLFRDEDSLMHPEGAAKITKTWLRDGAADEIKELVIAMINIVPESAYEHMKHMSVETVFGVPGGVFKSSDDAADWFNESLAEEKNIRLDAESFK